MNSQHKAAWHGKPLTKRQKEVALLICEGCTDKDIAQRLGIAFATARAHVANTIARMGVHSKLEVVAKIEQIAQRKMVQGLNP